MASKIGAHASWASSGPEASTVRAPSSAGFFVPSTGESTNVSPRSSASASRRSVASMPTVLAWIQSASSLMASSAPPSVITWSTA